MWTNIEAPPSGVRIFTSDTISVWWYRKAPKKYHIQVNRLGDCGYGNTLPEAAENVRAKMGDAMTPDEKAQLAVVESRDA